jgi:predicted secreted protein
MFAQINLEISSHYWRFETGWLDALRAQKGLGHQDATIASVRTCQNRFVGASEVMAKYFAKHREEIAAEPEWVESHEPRSASGELEVTKQIAARRD